MNKVQNGNADNNAKAKKRMATLYLTMLCVFITAMLTSVKVHANSNNHWQPVASETLLKLPANLIEKRIQQDFEMSPLANQLLSLESNIAGKGDKIKAL
jgi:hypothetical protein